MSDARDRRRLWVLTATAYHEAGHAVVVWFQGVRLRRASIVRPKSTRSTRDLLNTLAAIAEKKADFRQAGRKPKLTAHQRREALLRRENGEIVRDIAKLQRQP
jgi:hypothetical protein